MMIEPLTILKMIHLVGLVMGLGGAIYCDLYMLKNGVMAKLTDDTVERIEDMSKIVTLGLGVLWASGLLLVFFITRENPAFWSNGKFWAKATIVVVLTLNGMAIHRLGLPFARARIGHRLFEGVTGPTVGTFALLGAISSISWGIPFLLGKAPELSYVVPYAAFFPPYIAMIGAFWLGMWGLTTLIEARMALEDSRSRKAMDRAFGAGGVA